MVYSEKCKNPSSVVIVTLHDNSTCTIAVGSCKWYHSHQDDCLSRFIRSTSMIHHTDTVLNWYKHFLRHGSLSSKVQVIDCRWQLNNMKPFRNEWVSNICALPYTCTMTTSDLLYFLCSAHSLQKKNHSYALNKLYEVCPKNIWLYFFPAVSNGERVGKQRSGRRVFHVHAWFFAASQHCRMRLSLPDREVV
jgi:hypothetical protein